MIITNKRIIRPTEIQVGNAHVKVKVVDSFKLLGVTIDEKLNFSKHVSNVRKIINFKLFGIKRIFYLCNSVKIQFFKTFILPCFDYCSSLLIYFPKSTIQKISNCYNMCLNKLLNFKLILPTSLDDSLTQHEKLEALISFNRI
jgi:hypothetical protein